MIFKLNEAAGGLKHAARGWQRVALRKPFDRYVPRFSNLPTPATISLGSSGQVNVCSICGYALVRMRLDNGWELEVCSSEPILSYGVPDFQQWQKALPSPKVPTSCV